MQATSQMFKEGYEVQYEPECVGGDGLIIVIPGLLTLALMNTSRLENF